VETRSTCCYCGVGCGVIIDSDGATITGVRGDPDHPANFGRLCSKGSTLHLTARQELRALYPEWRDSRHHPRQRIDWHNALEMAADRFAAIIRQHGPNAVGFYISGQLLTEDYYVFNKLVKGIVGSNNVDTNSRLCMSSAVAGYKATLGADAPPGCYQDIDLAQCVLVAGANPAWAHPILFRRLEAARQNNPAQKMIVVDPRRTDTANLADLHLPILPGTDVVLFNAMLHTMVWEGWLDQDFIANHTQGFAELKKSLRDYTPRLAAEICGIQAEDIYHASQWFAQGPTLSLYCQGLNQSIQGTDKNAALINLHLATGQIGKPGAAPLSLTGQPNAMGGREVGGLSNLLSAHRTLSDPQHRAEVAALWGIEEVPAEPGKTAVEMFEAARRGEIKALWIACTNPAQSMPDLNLVRASLEAAEFVVVQEAFLNTDTVPYADLLLPATTWGEKGGTVTNSERRISRVQPAVAAPGEARHDWQIAAEFGQRLAAKLERRPILDYSDTETIFNEHRASTVGRDLDIGGLSYQRLEQQGPQQWPLRQGAHQGLERLYGDGIFPTADGKAHFVDTRYVPLAEDTDTRYPLHLNTGRLRDQWHGMSRTGNASRLFSHTEEAQLSMNPNDMQRRDLVEGDMIRVTSRRGRISLRVTAAESQRPGQVFLPMHWGSRFMNGLGANALTLNAFDPQSKQPELKHAAVQVEKLSLPWQMTAMRRGNGLIRMNALQPLLRHFDFASLGLFGHDEALVILRVAHSSAVPQSVLEQIDIILGLDDETQLMNYRDDRRGISKRALMSEGKLLGIRLTGETAAHDWLKEVIADHQDATALRPWLFAPLAEPPQGQPQRGRILCNCMNVSEQEILQQVQNGLDLATLQGRLGCGTQCGSCLPEIKRFYASSITPA
jgi:assimilatory nitrate reductase catalytic subunit